MVPHTSTGEWQSFETRMRRRRAERLALRAEVAVEAGYPDDARTLIEEARALEPDLPAVAHVEQLLSEEIAPASNTRSWRGVLAVAATLVVAATAGYAWGSRPAARLSARPIVAQLPLPAAPTVAVLNEHFAPAPMETALADEPLSLPAVEPPISDLVKASRDLTLPASPALATDRTDAAPPQIQTPLLPVAAGADDVAVAANLRLDPIVSTPAAVEPPPAPPVASAPAEPPQEPLVRTVLARYASAYNTLDADAAQRVWPGVNYPALSRAFEALSSQQVSLGDCRIDVAGNRAQARCAGSTSWTPKVGSRSHTEARIWMFDLTREGPDWQIVSARVQNR